MNKNTIRLLERVVKDLEYNYNNSSYFIALESLGDNLEDLKEILKDIKGE